MEPSMKAFEIFNWIFRIANVPSRTCGCMRRREHVRMWVVNIRAKSRTFYCTLIKAKRWRSIVESRKALLHYKLNFYRVYKKPAFGRQTQDWVNRWERSLSFNVRVERRQLTMAASCWTKYTSESECWRKCEHIQLNNNGYCCWWCN